MILFLDFDGVLHPWPYASRKECFSRVDLLERFLQLRPEYAGIKIVITSTWRKDRGLAELQMLLPMEIAKRVIGVTPVERDQTPKGVREQEILKWLIKNNRLDEPWFAIDDLEGFFDRHKERVFFCDNSTGLTEDDFPKLEALIERSAKPMFSDRHRVEEVRRPVPEVQQPEAERLETRQEDLIAKRFRLFRRRSAVVYRACLKIWRRKVKRMRAYWRYLNR